MRVRIALSEKQLPYESHVVTLDDVGDEVPRLNPKGEVPVLVVGDCVIYEDGVIAEYLEDRFPRPALYPEEPGRRARARLLVDWVDAELLSPVRGLERAHVAEGLAGEPTDPEHESELHRIQGCLRTLGGVLRRHPDGFLLGDFGIVDIFSAPLVVDLDAIGVRRDELPHVVAEWVDRLRDRPSVAQETEAREAVLGLR